MITYMLSKPGNGLVVDTQPKSAGKFATEAQDLFAGSFSREEGLPSAIPLLGIGLMSGASPVRPKNRLKLLRGDVMSICIGWVPAG
jgi:hypothetical protein